MWMQAIYRYGPEDTRLNQVEDLTRRYIGRWQTREGVILNTDEHPRLEFAMPLTYANQDTLKLNAMQAYYSQHLSKLRSPEGTFTGENALGVSVEDRRAWQQLQLRK